MYDPASNVWTSIQNIDRPKVICGAVNFKEDVFVTCIEKQGGTSCCSLQSYDVDNNEWKPCAIIRGDIASELRAWTWTSLACLRIPKDIFRTLTVVL